MNTQVQNIESVRQLQTAHQLTTLPTKNHSGEATKAGSNVSGGEVSNTNSETETFEVLTIFGML